MPGSKQSSDHTYLTPRRLYREAITAADAVAPSSSTIPAIRLDYVTNSTRIDPQGGAMVESLRPADRAYNGHLELYVKFAAEVEARIQSAVLANGSATAHANVLVWVNSTPQAADYTGADLDEADGAWHLVHVQSVTCHTLITLRDIPAGQYKVTVDFITPGKTLSILEAHTE